jgi:hypothetical protein
MSGRVALVLTTALAPAAWGTTYIVTTELLPADRPLLAALGRALPVGLALAAVSRLRPAGGWWIKILVLGTLNIGGFFALLFLAANRLPGGVAATLGAVQPLVAASLASLLLSEPLRSMRLSPDSWGSWGSRSWSFAPRPNRTRSASSRDSAERCRWLRALCSPSVGAAPSRSSPSPRGSSWPAGSSCCLW